MQLHDVLEFLLYLLKMHHSGLVLSNFRYRHWFSVPYSNYRLLTNRLVVKKLLMMQAAMHDINHRLYVGIWPKLIYFACKLKSICFQCTCIIPTIKFIVCPSFQTFCQLVYLILVGITLLCNVPSCLNLLC